MSISSMRTLWRERCKRSGFTFSSDKDAKTQFVAGMKSLRRRMRRGEAFVHGFIDTTHAHDQTIEHVVYCEGYMFASSEQEVRVWEVETGAVCVQFTTREKVVCMHACGAETLAAGLCGGTAAVWSLRRGRAVTTTLEVDTRTELGFVVADTKTGILVTAPGETQSSTCDARVAVWCAKTGSLLHRVGHVSWATHIHQVTLLPAEGAVNPHTLREGEHSLLVKFVSRPMCRAMVTLFSWASRETTTSHSPASRHGHLSSMRDEVAQTWFEHGVGCPRSCHVVRGRLVCAPGQPGNKVLVYDLNTRQALLEVRMSFWVWNIVAAGSRYAVVEGQSELVLMDLSRCEAVAFWPLEYERFVTAIVCGDTPWLDSLEGLLRCSLLLAVHGGLHGGRDGFQTICWRDS